MAAGRGAGLGAGGTTVVSGGLGGLGSLVAAAAAAATSGGSGMHILLLGRAGRGDASNASLQVTPERGQLLQYSLTCSLQLLHDARV